MTNWEHFKGDAEALRKEFQKICDSTYCGMCKYQHGFVDNCACVMQFACDEHEEPKPGEKKRRLYTWEEAQGLRGKKLKFEDAISESEETIYRVSRDKNTGKIFINGREQKSLFDHLHYIDGEPFGVLEEAK